MMRLDLSKLPGVKEVAIAFGDGSEMVIDAATRTVRLSRPGTDHPLVAGDVAHLVSQFLDHLQVAEDLKPQTIDGYRRRLGQFARWLAECGCDPGAPATWMAYYATLQQRKLSAFTRKGHYDRLRRFARWLVEIGRLDANPMDGIYSPRLPKDQLPKAVAHDDIKAMLAAATTPRDRALLTLLRDSGGRAAEILGMRWSHVEMDERRIKVIGKGDKFRYLYFTPAVGAALTAYRETVSHESGDPVWLTQKGSLTHPGLRHVLKRLAAKAGVEGRFNPHAWRHAFGRDMTINGAPTVQLQGMMGHGDIRVTTVYTKFDDAEIQTAHDRYSPTENDLMPNSCREDEKDLTRVGDVVK